ncbi:succinic semialdehyde dehydrogenase [Corynebacterium alimapuense]|uniref:Succinic semialdehyde dehydrogenase n=1 Tax=Corynebacterium alimapuense TaxID=1576874 RepID=A0A3M8K4Y6_9CORY|nr:succinic semialdehyde dehydrogenase [Corynebacterium alimapuense]RNE48160.1 succinic semialdehyde dehydrogenase [Corynebacterium alimapuense]
MSVTATTAEVHTAFLRARHAQSEWERTPVSARREIMLAFHDLVLDHQVELLDLIQDETGKSRSSAFDEIMDAAITARHYGYRAARLLRTSKAKGALPLMTSTVVERSPKGVVGIIAPWNYPLTMAMSDAIPALLAGNAVVLKPDEKTTRTALRALELLKLAGLPPELMQITPGPGESVGQAIVAECDYLMFTGSSATGRILAAQAGERLIGFSAELGGKNPMIVCADADVETAARGAVNACFSNTGQLCISIERIFVHEDIAEAFTTRFRELTQSLRIGPGHDWTLDVGCLISQEHLERVSALVDDALNHGARALTGGHPLPELGPTFYAPTVLVDVPTDAELYANEVFGPVVTVETVSSHDIAVQRANASAYGLNASVWGKVLTARKIASQLECGTVNINEGFAATWASIDAPMGGWKDSGVGRRHADDGLLKYTESRTIAVQRWVPLSGPHGVSKQSYAQAVSTALKWSKRILR